MGMYTEILFRARLVESVPEDVLSALRVIIGQDQHMNKPPGHELFNCPRWDMLGTSSSYGFPGHGESYLTQDDTYGFWQLFVNGDLKNYHSEIEKFFGWIDPYVEAVPGEFLGYSLYEDVDPETAPTNYYKKADK